MVVLPVRETLTGWSNGLTGTSCSSTERNAKPCTSGVTPCSSTCWELARWKSPKQKMPWGQFHLNIGKNLLLCGSSNTGTCCPVRWLCLHPCRYSKHD